MLTENIGGIIHLVTGDSERLGQQIKEGNIDKNSLGFFPYGTSVLLQSKEIPDDVKDRLRALLSDIHKGDVDPAHWEAADLDLHRLDVNYLASEGSKRADVILKNGTVGATELKDFQMVVGAFYHRYQAILGPDVKAQFEKVMSGKELSLDDISTAKDEFNTLHASVA